MNILVTGGTGYIGSHTVVELLQTGYDVTILDNLAESDVGVLDGIEAITGKRPAFYQADLRNKQALKHVLEQTTYDAVIHFAGYKAVGDSVKRPLWYYDNNVVGSVNLLNAMIKHGVKNLVFSSSCTVYGDPDEVPVTEKSPLKPTNPYGKTKLVVENMLRDQCAADPEFNAIALRYFNPVGAHKSALIGESPKGVPNNLMPYICQVAVRQREKLNIFGGDYPTPDGTCIRDYLHVVDLAKAHVRALAVLGSKLKIQNTDTNIQKSTKNQASTTQNSGLGTRNLKSHNFVAFNLGTGIGYSVLKMVSEFQKATGVDIPYDIVDRRPGDAAVCFGNPGLAESLLGWEAEHGLEQMCRDAWRWQKRVSNFCNSNLPEVLCAIPNTDKN